MTPRSRPRARREVSAGGIVYRRTEDGVRFLIIRDSYQNWGFPKGHLESQEDPVDAALREVAEETGLETLLVRAELGVIDWFFRFRGRTIHKFCHFFLFESPQGDPTPQLAEGITECRWEPYERAHEMITYTNARDVLVRAGERLDGLDLREVNA